MSIGEVHYDAEKEILFVNPFRNVSPEEMRILLEEMIRILEGKTHRRLLADVSSVPGLQMNKETRNILKEKARELNLERMAVVGASPITRMLAKIVTTVLGVRGDTKFFRTVTEAVDWIIQETLTEVER